MAGTPELPNELEAAPTDAGIEDAAPEEPLVVGPPQPPAWDGPLITITHTWAAVYATPEFVRKKKLGYLRNGASIAVKKERVSDADCTRGWYEVVTGGYICNNSGTLDPKDPQLKFAMSQPKLDDVLPYQYARNAKNGTPLYKSVPTPEQMYGYEPYLEAAKEWRKQQAEKAAREAKEAAKEAAAKRAAQQAAAAKDSPPASDRDRAEPTPRAEPDRHEVARRAKVKNRRKRRRHKDDDQEQPVARRDVAPPPPPPPAPASASAPVPAEGPDEEPTAAPEVPWWQQEDPNNLHEVTLEQLQAEADDVLAMRMMKGFYVAIDRTFRWNERLWYKTTKGMVGPADRFWQVAGSKFHGVELGQDFQLPVGFVYGSRKQATAYALDSDSQLKPAKEIEHFSAVDLTGQTKQIGKNDYWETKDGHWIKAAYVRVAQGGEPPENLDPKERWIDINVKTQTLVAYVGTRPVYATMVSSGKESSVKEKDHRTPRGEWRIREKHLTTTMDGNGTAAGDLPYSIEDVPYVAYFHKSYAVHGAFWHSNYGVRMSHGCVNLAPLDAKWVFFFTDPQVPAGWHGVWATEKSPGSRVVIHE